MQNARNIPVSDTMNVLEITNKANERMNVFPEGKKKIAIVGGAIILFTIAVALIANSSDQSRVDQPVTGSDIKDLAIARPATGVSIRGTVTINDQIPLPRGFVVAYGESMSRAIASSPIERDGSYKLDNVLPIPLVLTVKPKLTDDPNPENPVSSSNMPGLNVQKTGKRRGVDGVFQGGGPSKGGQVPGKSGPSFLTGKQPSKELLSRLKADVVTADMQALPEVRWLIDYAFYKYDGLNPDTQKIIVPEGKKVFMMKLSVP